MVKELFLELFIDSDMWSSMMKMSLKILMKQSSPFLVLAGDKFKDGKKVSC